MSETSVQVIIATFYTPDGAGKAMTDLKEGKKEGLVGVEFAGDMLGGLNNLIIAVVVLVFSGKFVPGCSNPCWVFSAFQ